MVLACGQPHEKKGMPAQETERYRETLAEVQSLEGMLAGVSSATLQEVERYMAKVNGLRYKNDTTGMGKEGKEACGKLEHRIDVLKRDAESLVSRCVRMVRIPVAVNDDCLLEKTTAWPVYLERGDVLCYRINLQKPGTVKLYDVHARTLLKTYAQKMKVADSLVVSNKSIYLIEITPGAVQYAAMDITYRMADHPHPPKAIKTEETESRAGEFRAVSSQGLRLQKAFDQPRKFTLSSQLKSSFSGAAKSRALVAVQVPSGTTEILYSLRISTSEQDRYSDGKFPENMNNTYRKIRFLGLPIYESTRSSGLLNTLLDDNRPLREEDAYCNMYVFRTQWAAKQFQDGTKQASQLQYDVDYSTLGTQSCNGRIPTKGAKTIYLAFENERVRYSNYIWIEAVAAIPTTEYHTTKYTVE